MDIENSASTSEQQRSVVFYYFLLHGLPCRPLWSNTDNEMLTCRASFQFTDFKFDRFILQGRFIGYFMNSYPDGNHWYVWHLKSLVQGTPFKSKGFVQEFVAFSLISFNGDCFV
jgi:hypothetical protein